MPPFIFPILEAAEIHFPLRQTHIYLQNFAREANFNSLLDIERATGFR